MPEHVKAEIQETVFGSWFGFYLNSVLVALLLFYPLLSKAKSKEVSKTCQAEALATNSDNNILYLGSSVIVLIWNQLEYRIFKNSL